MDILKAKKKKFFALADVSKLCNVKPAIIKSWEHEFATILPPIKRRLNGRFFTREDLLIFKQISRLFYQEKYSISEIKNYFHHHKDEDVITQAEQHNKIAPSSMEIDAKQNNIDNTENTVIKTGLRIKNNLIQEMREELQQILNLVKEKK